MPHLSAGLKITMRIRLPALNLKAKLMALMVMLLGLTLGAEVMVSLNTQNRIVEATQDNVKELASAIQISVQELTSVGTFDRERLQNYVNSLHNNGLEVSIASSKDLIINSSNPALIGEAINRGAVQVVAARATPHGSDPLSVPAFTVGPADEQTVYLIPVEVEDHLLGYVQVVADFADFARPLEEHRIHLLTVALAIFAIGLVFSYVLADRYVEPIHAVAAAAQNIAARGLEPVPEAHRRDEIGLLTRSFNEMVDQLRRARAREAELNRLERFTALGQLAGALAAPVRSLSPGMGFSILIESFIVTVIGGMGSIAGALVSALLIGMVRGFGTIGFPKFTDGLIYIVMIAILLLRPQGLFGRRS